MLYRSIVLLNALPALTVGFAAAISPGWWLFQRHFSRFWEVDWRLTMHAKSLMLFLGVACLGFGLLLLAALWVQERRARLGIAVALCLTNLMAMVHSFVSMSAVGANVVNASLLGVFAFLALASLVLIFAETIAFTVPPREQPA
ncbi:MAG TPA: hypothetical protein VHQ65_12920 [Thermoanaerobaculia bacterium]|nr:hypothetical protein [Thermoanaerobaculia bacterium]